MRMWQAKNDGHMTSLRSDVEHRTFCSLPADKVKRTYLAYSHELCEKFREMCNGIERQEAAIKKGGWRGD